MSDKKLLEFPGYLLKAVNIFSCVDVIRLSLSPCLIELRFGLAEKLLYQRISKELVRLFRLQLLKFQRSFPLRLLPLPVRLALEPFHLDLLGVTALSVGQ